MAIKTPLVLARLLGYPHPVGMGDFKRERDNNGLI